ncbi:MAG: NADH-quinone oxidoreductase subunit M [Armatimonadota bacterium]|nr:NADH-quinone oxidoreductase subunit M [Armatimonadota bacterium]MDR7463487.1 NADH-quinone oxidoreductase subunit M [Armatimonadota bacterium]MDR7470560.1 NADH-quinone oxidoreductase subunit M [Armatimonadota bacterium]MDR7474168.1 NADH-quinone oxidoreductase subunit M [Armatimonadota bacterium]MDR7539272.1 NADH-quinone oxidoreductase subunit M [Armatimonadota bacterium]
MLSLMVFLPLAGGILLLFFRNPRAIRGIALGASLLSLYVAIVLLGRFNLRGGMQMVESAPWIPSVGISYAVGLDGLSLPLVLLTQVLSAVSIVYSWRVELRLKEYMFLLLLLQTAMLGVFVALDFFLFYIFWEVTLVPMYFLIGIWGGPRREYAAIKFFLFTLVGSLAMLVGILLLYFNAQPRTFDVLSLIQQQPLAKDLRLATIAFWGFFLSFAIKVPMWPFHTWLPDAHVEAPTAGSVILAGILLKLGTYGFVRFSLPLFPQVFQQYAYLIAVLALLGIIYGALVSMAQMDLKKLVAYSSVNHMGYVMLGVAAAAAAYGQPAKAQPATTALNGAVFEMVAHGVITGSLFMIVGVIYDYRAHTRGVNEFGGLGAILPVYTGITTIAMLASLGLPGLMGFVAEFLIFLGAFGVFPALAATGLVGIIITAAMFLWTIQRIFLGPPNPRWKGLLDVDTRELVALVPLVAAMVIFGLYPRPLLEIIDTAMTAVVAALR